MASGITLTSSPTTLTGSHAYVYGPSPGTYTVTNLGTVAATGNNFPGAVYLKNGGTVTNGSSAAVTGFGTNAGIAIVGTHGAVTNLGTIAGGASGRGVELYDGGLVVNGSSSDTTAAISGHGGFTAVFINGATAGIPAGGGTSGGGSNGIIVPGPSAAGGPIDPPVSTVVNYGTIGNGDARSGVAFSPIAGSGLVINGSTADTSALIISGSGTSGTGVYFGSPSGGTIVNFATIGGTAGRSGVYIGPSAGGVTIANGTNLDTTALITGGATFGSGVSSKSPTGPVIIENYGTIQATASPGIYLVSNATIINGSPIDTGALIDSQGYHPDIYTDGGFTTVKNFGTIASTIARSAIAFGTNAAGGLVINGNASHTAALIAGGATAGLGVASLNPGAPATVENYGTITSTVGNAVYLAGGGTIINGSSGDKVASLIGNTLHAVIDARHFVTISNFGTISDPAARNPALLTGGAMITNGAANDHSALITAVGSGVHSQGTLAGLTLTNFGTIANTGTGSDAVYTFGGTITNGSPTDTTATMSVAHAGSGINVFGPLPGPITNFGTIVGGDGIFFNSTAGAGTVVNAGTIASRVGTAGYAIHFQEPDDRVVVDPGAVFTGRVLVSGGGTNVLELAAGKTTGQLAGLGTKFSGFTDTTVDAGAYWQLTGTDTIGPGATLAVTGTLVDLSGLQGTGMVAFDGGTGAFNAGLASSVAFSLAGPAADTLILPDAAGATITNAISGFGLGDRIEIAGVSFDGGSLNGAALQLTSGGGTVFTLDAVSFDGIASPNFKFGTDGATGNNFVEIACFAAGTRILTTTGEVPAEDVRAGMLVPSLTHGRPVRVAWVGHRQVNCAAHPRPHEVWPVRVARHAFGPDAPHRDLYLSPDHAVALPGERGGTMLVPVRYLVNGATIVQERRDSVGYFHVELERHGVLLAEGLPAESYLDTGNRSAFANGGATTLAHPDFARGVWARDACAPLVVAGPALARARAALLYRASALGFALTGEPGLVVITGAHRVTPTPLGAGWLEVELPADAIDARLVSRTMVPAEFGLSGDCRRLGVAIGAITLDDAPVALDDARLRDGWHPMEPALRWTGGDARIALAGQRLLRLRIAACGQFWVPARLAASA